MCKKKVGRPKNFKLSQQTKDKIAKSKLGKLRTIETKEKISGSLLTYFRLRNTVEKDLIKMYGKNSSESEWIKKNKEAINQIGVDSISRMRSRSYTEIPCGSKIEFLARDEMDPEKICLLAEAIQEKLRKLLEEGGNK